MFRVILLLAISNVFMTFAWYGHLRYKQSALWLVIIASWLIAFFEYCFQVPANRIGHNAGLSAAKLKTIQEVITLIVFVLFAVWYLKEPIRWNVVAGFICIAIGATLIFAPWANQNGRLQQPTNATAKIIAGDSSGCAEYVDTSASMRRTDEQ